MQVSGCDKARQRQALSQQADSHHNCARLRTPGCGDPLVGSHGGGSPGGTPWGPPLEGQPSSEAEHTETQQAKARRAAPTRQPGHKREHKPRKHRPTPPHPPAADSFRMYVLMSRCRANMYVPTGASPKLMDQSPGTALGAALTCGSSDGNQLEHALGMRRTSVSQSL